MPDLILLEEQEVKFSDFQILDKSNGVSKRPVVLAQIYEFDNAS